MYELWRCRGAVAGQLHDTWCWHAGPSAGPTSSHTSMLFAAVGWCVVHLDLCWSVSSVNDWAENTVVDLLDQQATAVLWSTGLCAIYLVSRHYCPSNRPTCYMIDHLRWPISTRATHWSRDPCPTWPVTHDQYIKLFVNITTLSDLTTNNNNECVNIGSLHFLDQSWTETKDWDQTAQLNLVSVRNWD